MSQNSIGNLDDIVKSESSSNEYIGEIRGFKLFNVNKINNETHYTEFKQKKVLEKNKTQNLIEMKLAAVEKINKNKEILHKTKVTKETENPKEKFLKSIKTK